MPVIWPGLQSGFTSFLQGQSAEGLEDTAKEIAKLYHDAVQQAMPGPVPGATVLGLSPSPIENGFLDSFEQIFKAEKDLGPAGYSLAALGIVNYWMGKSLKPIPPPGMTATITHTITMGGTPSPLDAGIYSAFKGMSEPAVASGLVSAFTTHIATVSGLWTGTMPGPSGVMPAPPIPWVGLM